MRSYLNSVKQKTSLISSLLKGSGTISLVLILATMTVMLSLLSVIIHTIKKSTWVDEHVKNKQNISQLVAVINEYKDLYNPIRMVMDAGALGKKIQEELRMRHGLNIEAADKTRKIEFIELLNDDLTN